jgi:hypothetical protein
VVVEDTVFTSREEEEFQLEESEYEHSSEEPEDNINARQPTPMKIKPFQSLFELEDMASPYGGGEWGVRQFSGAAGTIEVEDFKREFTMCCELQKSRNPNFNPGLSRGRFQTDGRTAGRSDDGRRGVCDLDAL